MLVGEPVEARVLRSMLFQTLSALAACHAAGVLHGNLAPYRVLASPLAPGQYRFRLTDFSFSPPEGERASLAMSVRPSRSPPEMDVPAASFGPKSDVWSLASVFVEASLGFCSDDLMDDLRGADPGVALAHIVPGLSSGCADLILRMLARDPADRIGAGDALRHPFFDGIRDECAAARDLGGVPARSAPVPRGIRRTATFASFSQVTRAIISMGMSLGLKSRSMHLAIVAVRTFLAESALVEPLDVTALATAALGVASKHEESVDRCIFEDLMRLGVRVNFSDVRRGEAEVLNAMGLQLHVSLLDDMLRDALPSDATSGMRMWCVRLGILAAGDARLVEFDNESLARCIAHMATMLLGRRVTLCKDTTPCMRSLTTSLESAMHSMHPALTAFFGCGEYTLPSPMVVMPLRRILRTFGGEPHADFVRHCEDVVYAFAPSGAQQSLASVSLSMLLNRLTTGV